MINSNEGFPQGRWTPRLDSSNKFGVTVAPSNDHLLMVRKPVMGVMTRDEALNLAAWLFVMADPKAERFYRIVDSILKH